MGLHALVCRVDVILSLGLGTLAVNKPDRSVTLQVSLASIGSSNAGRQLSHGWHSWCLGDEHLYPRQLLLGELNQTVILLDNLVVVLLASLVVSWKTTAPSFRVSCWMYC